MNNDNMQLRLFTIETLPIILIDLIEIRSNKLIIEGYAPNKNWFDKRTNIPWIATTHHLDSELLFLKYKIGTINLGTTKKEMIKRLKLEEAKFLIGNSNV